MKWFDRKFEPLNANLAFDGILMRLRGTPLRLRHLIAEVDPDALRSTDGDTWSIQENIGHLLDLEELWIGRVEDFRSNEEVLRPADLSNKKTHLAGHNEADPRALLDAFDTERKKLIATFSELNDEQLNSTALHPRLKSPMTPVDLAYFVAEHDDHHLATIFRLSSSPE